MLSNTSGWASDVTWAETAPDLVVVAHGPGVALAIRR